MLRSRAIRNTWACGSARRDRSPATPRTGSFGVSRLGCASRSSDSRARLESLDALSYRRADATHVPGAHALSGTHRT